MADELAGLPEALEGAWAAIKNVDTWNALREYVERLAGDLNAERLRADTYVAKYEVAHERLQLLAASQNERADNALELWRHAEAELAALTRRIAEAPIAVFEWMDGTEWRLNDSTGGVTKLSGKPVHLVLDGGDCE